MREALWLLPGTFVPVTLSLSAGVCVALVVRRSAAERPTPPVLFHLVVGVPILALWALRAPFPDLGFDVLNYHLMHGERGLFGPIFASGDFYPYFFPYQNPAGDIVAALFRSVLGYRAGTMVSPLALLWAGEVLWRLLAPVVANPRVRAGSVLVILASEGVLWEVSGYMVDLLALPVLLEATRLAATGPRDAAGLPRRSAILGLLLGTAVALKLTNLVFTVPIALVAIARWWGTRAERPGAGRALYAAIAAASTFALPVVPHALLLLAKTGNPVFPYFNGLFASPWFPAWNIKDGRWGPESLAETALWPILSAFRPERLSELAATSGRLALGWVAALAAAVIARRDARLRALAVIVLLSGLFWGAGTGYHRYGLFCELLGGLVVVLAAVRLTGLEAVAGGGGASLLRARGPRTLAGLLAFAAVAQSLGAAVLALRFDWSGRPTVFYSPRTSAREALAFLRDRDLASWLPADARAALAGPLVWVDVTPKVNGIMTLLAPRAPMIGLQIEAFLDPTINLERLDEAFRTNAGRRAFSLAFEEDADAAESTLHRLGFPVLSRSPVSFPFFSERRRLDLVLFEVALPPPLARSPGGTRPAPARNDDPSLLGSLDGPVEGQDVIGDLLVRGWARDPGEDFLVRVFVNGVEAKPRRFRRVSRPDVAAALPQMADCRWAGYEALISRPAGVPTDVFVSVDFRSRDGRLRRYPGARIRWRMAPAENGTSPR